MTTTTPSRPRTKPSTRRLSEVASELVIPDGIVTTGWPAVERQCRAFGDRFDEWQRGAGAVMLGRRADGMYAATIGGVTLSIPRQVAKTWLVGRIVFALCILYPGTRVLWTAHRTRTSTQTFRKLQAYSKRKAVRPHMAPGRNEGIRTTNGEQEITFANGSVIMFGARENGFGRGFDEVDIEVFDEAQILTVRALDDMVPATNQTRHPHGALLFFMGTPPRPVDPGEAFTIRRDEALAGRTTDAVYIECSADPEADPDDEQQWAKANPSFPHRTPRTSMLRLRQNLPGDDSWRREALGIWDATANLDRHVFPADLWAARLVEAAPKGGQVVYGVRFSPNGATVAVSVAVRVADGPVHVEGVHHRSTLKGTRWLVDWLAARVPMGVGLVVDGKAGAGGFVRALRAAGVSERKITTPTTDQVITANTMFLDAVTEAGVTHIDDPALAASAECAGRRSIGNAGGWGLRSLDDDGDVTLIESAVLAHFGALTLRRPKAERAARKVVVL